MLVIHRQFKKMITAAKYLERKKDKSREETAALRSFNSMVISVCSIAFILILAVMVMLFSL